MVWLATSISGGVDAAVWRAATQELLTDQTRGGAAINVRGGGRLFHSFQDVSKSVDQ